MHLNADASPTAAGSRFLASPTWRWWAAAATLARLPGNLAPLAFLLVMPGSNGALAAAGYTIGVGLGAGWRGRAIDRAGMRSGLRREAALLAVMAMLVAVALAVRLPLPLVVLSAVGLGIAGSAIGVAYRAALPTFVREPYLPAAYTTDAVLTELSFVVSPLVVGGLLAITSGSVLFGLAGGLAIGAFLATGALPSRDRAAATTRPPRQTGWFQAALPVYLVTAVIGFGYGLLTAGLPVRAGELGWPATATSAVFALMSLASALSGIVVVRRGGLTHHSPLPAVGLLSIPFAAATLAIALLDSTLVLAIGMALFGAPLAPLSGISTSTLTERVAREAHARALAFAAAMVTIPSGAGFALAAVVFPRWGADGVLVLSALTYIALTAALFAAAAKFASVR